LIDLHKELRNIFNCSNIGKFYIKAKLRELLVCYASRLEDDIKRPFKNTLNQRQLKATTEAVYIIRQNFTYNFTVSEIAKSVFMSSSQLQYCFRTVFDQSVNEYILNARLNYSQELLKQPDYLIADVVYKIGLNSKSYFSKIFKNKFKILPSEYRRKFLNTLQDESF